MRVELPQGTLETLILKTLTWGPMHGYGIGRWIERTSDSALTVEEGSLYPALYRMERRGWVESDWQKTENNRRAKYYVMTAEGRRLGLPPWYLDVWGADPADVTTVLAYDEQGQAAAWVKRFGGPPGTGFVRLFTGDGTPGRPHALAAVQTAAELFPR